MQADDPSPSDPDPARGPSKRTNPEKIKRAAAHPARPGSGCKAAPGVFVPIVDHGRCEGKGDCVEVCPYDVFDVRRIEKVDFQKLGLGARLKVRVHGMKTAYTPRDEACLACGLCVVACPEDAIRLSAA